MHDQIPKPYSHSSFKPVSLTLSLSLSLITNLKLSLSVQNLETVSARFSGMHVANVRGGRLVFVLTPSHQNNIMLRQREKEIRLRHSHIVILHVLSTCSSPRMQCQLHAATCTESILCMSHACGDMVKK